MKMSIPEYVASLSDVQKKVLIEEYDTYCKTGKLNDFFIGHWEHVRSTSPDTRLNLEEVALECYKHFALLYINQEENRKAIPDFSSIFGGVKQP